MQFQIWGACSCLDEEAKLPQKKKRKYKNKKQNNKFLIKT